MAKIQVNTSLDPEDVAKLDEMAQEDGLDDRSPMVRKLIREESKRRQLQKNANPQYAVNLPQP